MHIWILSDLHIEQSLCDVLDPALDYGILIAAGDIHDRLAQGTVACGAGQERGK